ncbi:MAG: hypothetical protein PT119_07160 [Aphanizomenon gracile PMC627.10]|nr:hypothetical protein [Aphanizomenon gracile PMC627.10]
MLHTLFSDVPVEQQETVAGGDGSSCFCSNKKFSPEESKKFDEILRSFFLFPFPMF